MCDYIHTSENKPNSHTRAQKQQILMKMFPGTHKEHEKSKATFYLFICRTRD